MSAKKLSKSKEYKILIKKYFRFQTQKEVKEFHALMQKIILSMELWDSNNLQMPFGNLPEIVVYRDTFNTLQKEHLLMCNDIVLLAKKITNFDKVKKTSIRYRKKKSTQIRQQIKKVLRELRNEGFFENVSKIERGGIVFEKCVKHQFINKG